LFRTLEILTNEAHRLDEKVLQNSVTEAAVLHARNLCEMFLWSVPSKTGKPKQPRPDDITLPGLFPDWSTNSKYDQIKNEVSNLNRAYGEHDDQNAHNFAFNKLVMHSTRNRGAYGIYDQAFADLEPIIRKVVGHVESLTDYKFKPI
jgi:hypothetical protein